MSRPVADDDEELLDDEPSGSDADDESVGVDDADELLLAELEEGPEEVGLDVEALGSADALLALSELESDDDETQSDLDDATLEIDADIDAEGDEQGWTQDNEGSSEAWDEGLLDELEDSTGNDAGEEGVEDPLLDGLPDEHELPPLENEDDEELESSPEDEWSDELPAGIRQDA